MLEVLIIVDVQPDFCEGGALAVEGGNQVANDIANMVYWEKRDYDLIVTTQDWHDPNTNNGGHFSDTPDFVDTWPKHCLADTPGAAIHPDLETELPRTTFRFKKGQDAPSYSGFEGIWNGVGLQAFISGIESDPREVRVTVVGIATSHCVKATALDAVKIGYETYINQELCVGVTDELADAAVTEMLEAGVLLA